MAEAETEAEAEACLVVNPTMVDCYGFLFNCMTVGQDSDLLMSLM